MASTVASGVVPGARPVTITAPVWSLRQTRAAPIVRAALLAAMRWRTALPTRRARVAWGASVALWALAWLATTPAVSLGLIGLLEPTPTTLAALDDPALRARTAVVVLSSSVAPPTPGDTPLERLDAAGTARTIGAAACGGRW